MATLIGLHPFPTGWFAVAFTGDLAAGAVKTVHYFGQDIVLYRTEAGEAVAVEPFCPHLGAHLGHGGCVDGEVLECPFHHWRFDTEGRCVSIRGASKLPQRARLGQWPLCEQDGVVFVFHDAEVTAGLRAEPRSPFPFPPLGREGFTPDRTVMWTLRTHPQEICENTVDMAHLRPVHGVEGAHVVGKPHIDGTHMNVVLEFMAPGDIIGMPGQDNDVQLDVILDGLGRIVSRTYVKNVEVRARQAIYCTPIDGERMDLRGVVNTAIGPDPDFTESLAELFYESFVHDFQKDFPIWENKRYVERPPLSAADGPVGLYRRWARQFYPSEARDEPRETARAEAGSLLRRVEGRVRDLVSSGRELVQGRAAALLQREVETPASRSAAASPEPEAPRVQTAAEYFDTLDRRFRPSGARGVDAVFQWKLTGDDALTRYAVVRDGALAVHDGEHQAPTVTIAMDADDYVRMVNRELDGALAFTTGRAKLSGSIPMAMRMRKIFPQ